MSVPLSSKQGFLALFGVKKIEASDKSKVKKQLEAQQIARLFSKTARNKSDPKPSDLQLSEIHDRNNISVLRNSLYSK